MSSPFLEISNSRKNMTLLGLFLGFIILLLDNQTSVLALPAAANEIGGLEIYSLSSILGGVGACVAMPVLGFVGARNPGKKNYIYFMGMLHCAAVCLISSMAGNMFVIVVPRLLLGIGCSVIYGLGYLIIYDLFEGKTLGTVLGIAATVSMLGMVVSSIIMGFVTDTWGWRACFYVQIPLYILSGGLVFFGTRISSKDAAQLKNNEGSIDGLGTFAVFLLIGGLLPAISLHASYAPFGSLLSNALFIAAALGLILLILDVRKKKERAIVPANVLKDRNTICFTFNSLLNGCATMAVMFFLPLYVMNVMGKSATEAGLITTFSGIMGLFLGPFIGRMIADKGSARWALMVSIAGNMLLHILLIILLGPSLPIIVIYALMLLRSLTNVLHTLGQSAGVNLHIEPDKVPYTNSLVQLMNNFGPNFAIAIFTVILMSGPIADNINLAFVISLIFGAISLPVTFLIQKMQKEETGQQQQ